MPIFLIVSEIWTYSVEMVKNSIFFSKFLAYPPCRIALAILTVLHQNVRRSLPYILNYIWKYLRKIEIVAVHCMNDTTPYFFEF